MYYPFSAIDLTRQLVKLTVNPSTGASEGFYTDLLIKGLSLIGWLDVSFETDEPSNTRKLWFDAGQPPTGNRGILKVWDPDLEEWVPMTPARWYLYETRLTRATVWYTSKLLAAQSLGPEMAATVRPPDAEAFPGDLWEHDVGADNEISMYRQTAPGQYQWVDMTGGDVDQATIVIGHNHTQTTPATMWTITHGLGYRPIVMAWDNAGAELDGTVAHVTVNQVTITFLTVQSGFARLA